ncbi:MAG: 4-hydroxybutyrate CoA-transferase [Flavobacteriales bacterium]|nr:4-hydroxybutyrate CoA-transferase [Flavobacteriales bacterium]
MKEYVSPENALSRIKNGDRVFVQGSAATPVSLLQTMAHMADQWNWLELVNISIMGDLDITRPEFENKFIFNSLFVSAPIRKTVNEGPSDYVPVFLSEIHRLFEKGYLPLDVALIHVSPPDAHGYCSLGVSVDISRSAVRSAKTVIAQVNPNMPRTHGDGLIHVNDIHAMVWAEDELPIVDYRSGITSCEQKIGEFCASIIEDRSTIQAGIGTIPDAVLMALKNHKDLGVHTEMFSNGVVDLMKRGVITNKFKKKYKGRIATAFAIGTRELYDFVDDNPVFAFLEAGYVNDERTIRANPRVVAINSALEIDLTGQVCSDSIGTYQYSGVGGQMDFIRGASFSEDGRPIIAMPSVTAKGVSKIVPVLKAGAGVVTTRAHVHYVITEYGVADLFGKNLRQRAEALLKISHPDHQEALDKEIRNRFGSKIVSFSNR